MFAHLGNTQKGILLGLAGYSCFAFADICSKWLSLRYPVYQIVETEALLACLFLLAAAPWLGGMRRPGSRRAVKIHALRMVLNFLINALLVFCFTFMPLAAIYTMVFVKPFFAALLAMPLYGEQIGRHRWIAIALGFAGVAIALKPAPGDFDPWLFLPLFVGFLIALMFVSSRSLQGESGFSLGFYPFLGTAVLALPLALPGLVVPEAAHMPVFALAGLLVTGGILFLSLAFRIADASLVSPFLYTEMIWGVLFGYLIFGDTVDGWMIAGAAMIIGSGLYLLRAERNHNKTQPSLSG